MRIKVYLISIFIFVEIFNIKHCCAQNTGDSFYKNFFTAGIGYFCDICQFVEPGYNEPEGISINPKCEGKIMNGSSMLIQYGRRIDKKTFILLHLSEGHTVGYFNDEEEQFWNEKYRDQYFIISAIISKSFLSTKRYELSFGLGPLFRNYKSPRIYYEYSSTDYSLSTRISTLEMSDLGATVLIENNFKINKTCYVGIQISSNYILDVGLETFRATPVFKMYF